MKRAIERIILAGLFFLSFSPAPLFSKVDKDASADEIVVEDTAAESAPQAADIDGLIVNIRNANTPEAALDACNGAIGQCKTYEDYEKLSEGIKKLRAARSYAYPDVLDYACAKTRIGEMAYLTKKNDIESGRIYMSVNEKYYNEALECLDKAALATRSKDLELDIYFLRFIIFKEMFQPEKVDAVFNEMVGKIALYSEDSAGKGAKLNETSKKVSDNGMGD